MLSNSAQCCKNDVPNRKPQYCTEDYSLSLSFISITVYASKSLPITLTFSLEGIQVFRVNFLSSDMGFDVSAFISCHFVNLFSTWVCKIAH